MAKAKASVKAEPASIVEYPVTVRRSARNSKKLGDVPVKQEDISAEELATPIRRSKRPRIDEETNIIAEPPPKLAKKASSSPSASSALTRAKAEVSSSIQRASDGRGEGSKESNDDKQADLRAKKLKSYAQFVNKSPFPDFSRPAPEECRRAYEILASLHGERQRPERLISAPADRAGCGDAPSVLDALVRTILSQNTSNRNSTQAKLDMDSVYGTGVSEERWDAIASGGPAKLEKAIARGGLGGVKSRAIVGILRQVKERYGTYSLDHLLRPGDDEEAMRELISFKGVGPKTASCVLLFCVGRDSFAVDTHVHRLTGTLGWRPPGASRDETFAHLDVRVPDPLKYGLHVLFVEHGRKCSECKAGGKALGKCELRKAFRRGEVGGEAEGRVKEEEDEETDLEESKESKE